MLAAGTALCWTASALCFEESSRRVGSVPVNLIRLVAALAMLSAFNALRLGRALPTEATSFHWNYLIASGLLGFFVGDLALFRAFVLVGARLTTLMMCLAPLFAAVTEWIWLDGRLSGLQAAGMGVTLAGVAWVALERPGGHAARKVDLEHEPAIAPASTSVVEVSPTERRRHVSPFGMALGVVAAGGQGVGLVCTKIAMSRGGALDPFEATQIRLLAGIVTFAGLVLLTARGRDVARALRDRRAMLLLTAGALAGPFLGVSMLNKAVETTPTGVAQTITSLVPILIIPLSVLIQKERVTPRAWIGAAVAVSGVALLVR